MLTTMTSSLARLALHRPDVHYMVSSPAQDSRSPEHHHPRQRTTTNVEAYRPRNAPPGVIIISALEQWGAGGPPGVVEV